ncbi:hypothetical protein [Nocardiopsis sp. MG754419]|uniref:hypothetical protein n=1 Tax=Nocardiopsis sp. MG754419 TaxID=2259865 RepID=UPI001BAE54F0|nr:hypothetical protein [Nocardiopsis sp. MG754419]MBR8745143.1 hypothetical protein [Nocardiopsis sp. MG754419]
MSTILPFPRTAHTLDPVELTALLGDAELASELCSPRRPGESHQDHLARHQAAADILADLTGTDPAPVPPVAFELRSAA